MPNARHYASNLEGTALFAYDAWAYTKAAHERTANRDERELYAGQCGAYSRIVRHVTGRQPTFFETRAALERFLGVAS